MAKKSKLLAKILTGRSDKNIAFRDLCSLLKSLGFSERIKGDHHIFTQDAVEEILNVQPKGKSAKAYQVKQVREIILRYHLGESTDE